VSELPGGLEPVEPPPPRPSALGVLARFDREGAAEFLFGLRSRRARFMPSHLAFPGGRMEPEDRPDDPGAYRRCATRELAEETGLEVAADRWLDAGERVTPPMFPVRFRTGFLVAELPAKFVPRDPPPSEENERLEVASAAEILERWSRDAALLPPPVLAVLRAVVRERPRTLEGLARVVTAANAVEESGSRVEFVRDVWVVPVRTRTLPPASHTNVWIPVGSRACAIVDPGSADPREHDLLMRVLARVRREAGVAPTCVLLTHHHQDHVSGAAAAARTLGVPVRAHPAALAAAAEHLDGVPARPLADGAVLDLGGLTLRALLTEGHARGHLAFVVAERDAMISGDLVSALSTMLIDPRWGDMDAYLASLDKAAAAAVTTLLPSHGPPVPRAALTRVREHRLEREARILSALAEGGATIAEIAARAYEDTPQAPAALADSQTLAHLIRLERAGIVSRDDAGQRWRICGTVP
jgi:glyoxylase-like metal-dependent hydrolase (beta-lactamase superfamily II)/8-oxo-dGTP pyrophosphatase MutT (NUDIX family)